MVGIEVEILSYSFYVQCLLLPHGELGNQLCRPIQNVQYYQLSIVLAESGPSPTVGFCRSEVNGIGRRKECLIAEPERLFLQRRSRPCVEYIDEASPSAHSRCNLRGIILPPFAIAPHYQTA